MGQPVKLSDQLVSDARTIAELSQRSIAGQIEFWAALGQSLEPLLRGDRAIALRQSGATRPVKDQAEIARTASISRSPSPIFLP